MRTHPSQHSEHFRPGDSAQQYPLRQSARPGQIIILAALAAVGLLAFVGLAIDGGMALWNQRRAQNGADAAAIAGTSALVTDLMSEGYLCGWVPEDRILNAAYQHADLNEVPDAFSGSTVAVYYLGQDSQGNRFDLPNPATGAAWRVGDTGTIPCADLAGLRVVVAFPQTTFFARIIGIMETDLRVEAHAVWDHRYWCTDFAVFGLSTDPGKGILSATGAGTRITNGGLHSNGGMQIGGGGQGIYLEPGRPVEYATDGDTQIGYDKIEGGPDPDAPDHGITAVDSYPLPDDFFYRFEDFAPGGFIWQETPADKRFFFGDDDLTTDDVTNPDGSLRDGLYVTNGSMHFNGLDNAEGRPWHATFVTRGEVQVSGGINQIPLARGVFIFTLSSNTSQGAVKLSGDENSWAGLIVAPNGNIDMSGARNSDLAGMLIGQSVDVSGSNNSINHRPEYCPPNPPRILLVQ